MQLITPVSPSMVPRTTKELLLFSPRNGIERKIVFCAFFVLKHTSSSSRRLGVAYGRGRKGPRFGAPMKGFPDSDDRDSATKTEPLVDQVGWGVGVFGREKPRIHRLRCPAKQVLSILFHGQPSAWRIAENRRPESQGVMRRTLKRVSALLSQASKGLEANQPTCDHSCQAAKDI